ncbi:MAG: aminotransferase class I/II-fold pyridoxal phosphate-dependent enzyme [Erysipelotrichaceae bacterium]|nr:aminotransferase class I/II-fold pyridoxal phosphate-dependent enzyme [Erysipelotrichaceae bacterium]
MKFVRKNVNTSKYVDNVFAVSNLAKQDPDGINATTGCLYGEDGKLLTYSTVFDNESNITNIQNASYASPEGNKEYLELIGKHVLEGKVSKKYKTLATSGGTGAIYLSVKSCLNEGDTIILPEVAWGNYKVIAQELNLNVVNYDVYNLDSLLKAIDTVNEKVFVVINSPSHNPCGHAYTYEEWEKIINKLNSVNKEVILLNDIAYIDYAPNNKKEYFKLFNTLTNNVLVILAYSCSKSFSYYGKRLGAFIAINDDEEFLDHYINMCARLARTTWSNCNNGAMLNIVSLLKDNYDSYIKERDESIKMLADRASLFIKQANENNLPLYPYTSGFFVSLKIEDLDLRDKVHQRLIDNHIYTVKVNKGIRIGICSLPMNKVDGLASKIKETCKDLL